MYWILFIMAAIVAMVLALIVGGLVTPRDHVVARRIRLRDPRSAVWATIRDFGRYGEWRHELEFAEVIDADQPQPRWRETSTRGSVAFGVTGETPSERLVAKILDDDLPFSGEWTWSLRDDAGGTEVSITERGTVRNPVFRFIGAHLIGYTSSIDRYLKALAERHGEPGLAISDATPT